MQKIDATNMASSDFKEAAELLRAGKLVAFPTETVYGLGGNAYDSTASARIYAAKGRPSDNPLIVHISCFDELPPLVSVIPDEAKALADRFWPGPLTMIFQKSAAVPSATTGGLDTVAVRMPSHPVALELIRQGGGYIAAPSANTSGRPSPTEAKHVYSDLNGRIDMIIDGGPVGIGLESTIIDLTEETPMVLRPGFISLEMLRSVLGDVRMDPGLHVDDPAFRPKAPGMKYRHYAPKASLIIVEGEESAVRAKIGELALEAEKSGQTAGIIATDEDASSYTHGIVRSAGTRSDEITIAQRLFGILREFDELQVSVIYSEAFDTPQLGAAIMNRLIKAAGHQVILA
jgi:L-threonylcarbamoyladenylate synthase